VLPPVVPKLGEGSRRVPALLLAEMQRVFRFLGPLVQQCLSVFVTLAPIEPWVVPILALR
jgi:hypothetical protein